jgi:SAM-dependent methyltransferase
VRGVRGAEGVGLGANMDARTVESFGSEWARFDQSTLTAEEHQRMFEGYFGAFPWEDLPPDAEGFDMGCGSGRWARLVAPRVGVLNCIDPAEAALAVARRNLAALSNVRFHPAGVDTAPLAPGSQDFGYSLGVLHHIPDTEAALATCIRYLKPGAPFLLYLYYAFDNRPAWFRALWALTERGRGFISRQDDQVKPFLTDPIALLVYLPLARIARVGTRLGLDMRNVPLYAYRDESLYTMRTDSRDRFGTPLEQRFSRAQIEAMMRRAGLVDIRFSEREPYWCAVGRKAAAS